MRIADVMRSLPRTPRELRPYLPLIALVGAMWPVWEWLAARAASDTGDAWALVSLATAAVLMWRDRAAAHGCLANHAAAKWGLTALLMMIYAASYPFALPLV